MYAVNGILFNHESERRGETFVTRKITLAVANILADVIIMLQKEIPVHLKKDGIFIMSGILNIKENAVKEALEQNPALEIIETASQGEWVSITARKC